MGDGETTPDATSRDTADGPRHTGNLPGAPARGPADRLRIRLNDRVRARAADVRQQWAPGGAPAEFRRYAQAVDGESVYEKLTAEQAARDEQAAQDGQSSWAEGREREVRQEPSVSEQVVDSGAFRSPWPGPWAPRSARRTPAPCSARSAGGGEADTAGERRGLSRAPRPGARLDGSTVSRAWAGRRRAAAVRPARAGGVAVGGVPPGSRAAARTCCGRPPRARGRAGPRTGRRAWLCFASWSCSVALGRTCRAGRAR